MLTLILCMQDIELKEFRAICKLFNIALRERDNHLMIPTLPTWVAALIHDIGLEVAIVWFVDTLKRWRSGPDESIWRLKVVDWISESHG